MDSNKVRIGHPEIPNPIKVELPAPPKWKQLGVQYLFTAQLVLPVELLIWQFVELDSSLYGTFLATVLTFLPLFLFWRLGIVIKNLYVQSYVMRHLRDVILVGTVTNPIAGPLLLDMLHKHNEEYLTRFSTDISFAISEIDKGLELWHRMLQASEIKAGPKAKNATENKPENKTESSEPSQPE